MAGSAFFTYLLATDTWHLAYQPEEGYSGANEPYFSDGNLVPEGDWTAFVSPYAVAPNSAIGLALQLDSGEILELLVHAEPVPADTEQCSFITFPGRQVTLRVECENGFLRFSYSEDEYTWTEGAWFSPRAAVSEVGLVLRYDHEGQPASGQAGFARLLEGSWTPDITEVTIPEPAPIPQTREAPFVPSVFSTITPPVHLIVGAQYGDLEFDVGKSVRWAQWFCDNVFVLDVNLGTPRYWIVNWTETFPEVEHDVTGINYFVRPTEFRKEQWRKYCEHFGEPADNDWILWIDAHEGLSVDNRTLPADYNFAPFQSFLWREIQSADDLGYTSIRIPYYVFLRSDNVVNITYDTAANDPSGAIPNVLQAVSTPYYLAHQSLRRLWKASELKNPAFDWSQLDVVTPVSGDPKIQIISYGYAHWNLQDIEPPATTVPPLTAQNDDGWRMRNLLSKVRAIPGLPIGDTWVPPSSDPAGLPGPWAPADRNNPVPMVSSGPYLVPTTGTASTPDPGPLPPQQYTFVCTVQGPTGATGTIVAQSENSATDRSFALNRRNTDGGITYNTYPDGTVAGSLGRTNQVRGVTGGPQTLALAVMVNDGTGVGKMDTYVYETGTWKWVVSGKATAPFASKDSSVVTRVGGIAAGANIFDGRIYSVECRTGLDPAGIAPAGVQTEFPGNASGYMESAFSPAYNITGDIEIVFRALLPVAATGQGWQVHRWYSAAPYSSQRSWWVQTVSYNRLRFNVSFTGALTDTSPQSNTYTFPNVLEWYKITRNVTTGDTQFYRAADQPNEPTVWTNMGTVYTPVPGACYSAPTAPLYMGGGTMGGRVARFIVRNGIGGPTVFDFNEVNIPNNTVTTFTPTVGGLITVTGDPLGNNIPSELLWRFDANEYPGTGTGFTDPRGRAWTLTSAAALIANTVDTQVQPVIPDSTLLGLITPLYDLSLRINMRDGVWYEENTSGNIPLYWDESRQAWTTDYDPATWSNQGVDSYDPSAVP